MLMAETHCAVAMVAKLKRLLWAVNKEAAFVAKFGRFDMLNFWPWSLQSLHSLAQKQCVRTHHNPNGVLCGSLKLNSSRDYPVLYDLSDKKKIKTSESNLTLGIGSLSEIEVECLVFMTSHQKCGSFSKEKIKLLFISSQLLKQIVKISLF